MKLALLIDLSVALEWVTWSDGLYPQVKLEELVKLTFWLLFWILNNLNDCPIQIDWVVQENIVLNTVSKYSFEVVLRSELIEEHQGWGKTTLVAGVGNKILWWQVFDVDDRWGRFYQSAYKNCHQHKDFVTKMWSEIFH